jgi:hypothetical protein
MLSWYDWLSVHHNRTSFLDDNHAGGTIKHIILLPTRSNTINETLVCMGYYGTDELLKLATNPENSGLHAADFMHKYNAPFHATIPVPVQSLKSPLTTPFTCTFKFFKDTHGTNLSKATYILSEWKYNPAENCVKITFNDFVMRHDIFTYNIWTSTPNVPYERDATLNQIMDRGLITQQYLVCN